MRDLSSTKREMAKLSKEEDYADRFEHVKKEVGKGYHRTRRGHR